MEKTTNSSRRELLKGLGAFSAVAATGLSLNANAATVDHSKMNHEIAIDFKLEELIDTFLECIKMGEICNQHCMHMFQMGDTSLADCSIAVQETIVANKAAIKFAAHNSKHLNDFIKFTIKVCETCEEECKKHDKHIQCRDGAEACRDCIDTCNEYLAA
mgnify:CR=1 FL=1